MVDIPYGSGRRGQGTAAQSMSVVMASDATDPPTAGVTLTDASIANASGASETIAALSTTRNVLIVANPSATVSWWINPSGGTAAANTNGSFELPPGAMWTPKPAPRNAVTGIATAGTDLTVKVG